ncbi:unnamed protein product [Miscanthus lutarioriparius]|uniref:Rp1-like protein n=1 Tax=Miscanthus lutarioriparius TaxID=422564 RepID=A0A811RFG5_9POAL|nr:unnamed protein product [Miscanthus lutarioriparius]
MRKQNNGLLVSPTSFTNFISSFWFQFSADVFVSYFHRSKLEARLRRLKEAFYDAEDLLDEHEYNLLKRKAKSGKDPLVGEDETSSIASTILKPLRAAKSRARNLLPENKKLISKMNELKAILTEAKELRDLLSIPPGNTTCLGWPAVPTTIVPPTTVTSLSTSKVFGRDRDRDRIVDFLLGKTTADEASSTRYSSLAIVGAGGMGKSTLAQYVYNDKRIEEDFDVRMWVCISRKLDVRRHTREIIESATNRECPCFDNLDTLQCKLRDILQKSEKFLLVLDDVWFEKSGSETEWFQLLDPLISKQSGSKVLVTSRRAMLPAAICCEQEQVILLENMEDADFLALFKHHAFSGAKIGDQVLRSRLKHTAEEIAKRLGMCPLAAKVLEGFVGSCNSSRTLEDVGMDYFNDKVSGSLFQMVSERHGSYYDSYYVMHDILHDLAESLSREDCFRLEEDNVKEIPCTVRHLSIRIESIQNHKQIIHKLYHLRTIICIDPLTDDASDIFYQMVNLKKLRVLYLSFYNSSKLPESIGRLKHLRYLNLIRTLISELPRSLCTLYHLQLLQLSPMVERLPDKLCNLSKLTSLQHMRTFSVQKKQGYELWQLKDLNELGGSLSVENLENVSEKDEALESMLYQKNRHKKLRLAWSSENGMDAADTLHLDILEGLRPSPQLSRLTIEGYKSGTYPRGNIMKTEDLASKLASMWEVNSGSDIREVLSEDYSSLKQLTTQMGDDISQHLQIIGSGLEEGGDIILVKENIIKAWLFFHEQRIRVIYDRTMELPLVLPSGICELRLFSCSITDGALAICLGGLTSLTTLHLGYNMALTALPSEEVFEHLTKLDNLTVTGLSSWQLQHLTLIDVPNLTAKCISQFRVQYYLFVSSFVLLNQMLKAEGFIVPPNLGLRYCKEPSASFGESANLLSVKHLDIWDCKMESLPGNLKFLFSLESLYISHCPNITSLPVLPSSLQRINIKCCDNLKKNCREPDGESWPQISHILWKHFD